MSQDNGQVVTHLKELKKNKTKVCDCNLGYYMWDISKTNIKEYLAADQQIMWEFRVGRDRENRTVETPVHVFGHPGFQKMAQDIWCDVACLKTTGAAES